MNGKGKPVRLILTPGQRNDHTQGEVLLDGLRPKVVIADKGYDSQDFVDLVRKKKAKAVIPTQRNRARQRRIDKALYKARNVCERFWAKVKQYRRVATRYEKKARNFLAFVQLASIRVLLGP